MEEHRKKQEEKREMGGKEMDECMDRWKEGSKKGGKQGWKEGKRGKNGRGGMRREKGKE